MSDKLIAGSLVHNLTAPSAVLREIPAHIVRVSDVLLLQHSGPECTITPLHTQQGPPKHIEDIYKCFYCVWFDCKWKLTFIYLVLDGVYDLI